MNQDSDPRLDKLIDSPNRTADKKWRRTIMAIAILLIGGTGSGLIYGWYFVQRKLVPLVETEVGKYLHRPLELGKLQSISPTGASFGNSALPATAENPDFVEIEAIKVNFAPLQFLLRRELNLDLTLVQPDIYIEQDEFKLWTPTNFGSDQESSANIKVNVKTIRLEQGQLALAAYNSETKSLNPTVIAKIDNAVVRPVDNQIEFDAVAELIEGGKFIVDGQSNNQTGIIDLDLIAQQLNASEVSNLLALPVELNRGDLDGQLGITIGNAPIPELQGTLNVDDVSLQIPNLVKPFSNSEGKLYFKGTKIELDDIATNFGQVSALASGSLDLAESGDYQIDAAIKPVAASKAIAALELDAPVPIKGKIQGDVAVRGTTNNPVVRLDLATASPSRLDKIDFRQINADLELIGTTLSVKKFTGLPKTGGEIEGDGTLQLDEEQNLAFDLRAENVSGKAIARSYNNQLPVDIGLISGQTKLLAQAGDLSTLTFQDGSANFALGNGMVEVKDLDYADGIWSSQLRASGVEFGSLPIGKGSVPTIAKALVDGVFEVSGTKDSNLDQVDATGTASLNTVGGQIALPNIEIANGNWKANANTESLKLQRLFPLPDEFNDNLSGEFYLTGNIPDDVQPQTLINGFGDLTLAEGRVKVEDLKIVDENWTAIATGSNLKLKELSSSTPEQFAGLVDGRLKLAGTTDNITPEGIIAEGNGSLSLPEGVFTAERLAIAEGQFQAQVTPENVALSLFADPNSDELELKGQLGGQLEVAGQVDNLSPTAVAAKGKLTFSEGIDLLEQRLSAAIVWDGKRLDVVRAKGNGLDAKGYVTLDESFFSDIPDKLAAVEYFEFDVPQAQGIDVTKLRLTLPSWATNLDYSGRGEFAGKISGIPSAMNIEGDLGLSNFKVEDLEFDPLLVGNVQISPETGVRLSLQEIFTTPSLPLSNPNVELRLVDEIELILDSNFAPVAFAIAQDELVVKGAGQNEIIDLSTQNVPVELLKTIALKSEDFAVPESFALQPVNGELSGDFTINLNTLGTWGKNVVIENPALASIRGDRLEGDFQYADGYFTLQDVEFQQRNSTYKLEGDLVQQPDDIKLDGRVLIEGGQIQDILVALQIFELTDFARIFRDRTYADAEELYSSPTKNPPLFDVGSKDAPVMEQLQLLAAVQAWLASAQQKRQNAVVPAIAELTGTFDGQIAVSGSLNAGLTSEFNFLGKQWQWGKLVGERIVARGNLQQGILTLLPISVKLQDTTPQAEADISPTLLFTGTFGGETQSGQFRLVEVPMELIEQLFNFPPELAFDGLINATASIAGTQVNPQARGEISINDASINETSIQTTKGSFNYRQSRLNFSASSIIAEDADPLIIKGSIPYQLPFAKAEPKSDRLDLKLNVKDKGLALLDIFSRSELKWIDGEGEIALDIGGVLDAEQNLIQDLVTRGTAKIENATIAAKSLPKNLITNINSQVFFDFDNIRVDSFKGELGGGEISAAGTVPLSQDVSANPLTIDFNEVKVELPKLYDGSIKGNLQILGKATQPDITGDLTLFDGTIFLADDETETQSGIERDNFSDQGSAIAERNTTDNGIAALTQYKDLQLRLGEDIKISQPPIFTFLAAGDLILNGTFLQPSPKGTIVLQRGQVNLFTTQLSLSRDYRNTARFSDNNVLDPFLDVLLTGSAIETTNRSIPSEVLPTEIPDSTLGTLETIRISAKVKGLASQITNNIELTSSPSRSPAEIAALLGGGFVEGLAGSSGTFGLATLAGSAIFGSLNAEFNNAFPLGEIRLFPTPIIEEDRDNNRDGLAGEIAFELIDNLSFSALKILNTDIPAQFGFRYRLNDNFVLRGSSDFQEDGSRALIEYEHRF